MKANYLREWSLKEGQEIELWKLAIIGNDWYLQIVEPSYLLEVNPYADLFVTWETHGRKITIYW